jgi:hypothetical protein
LDISVPRRTHFTRSFGKLIELSHTHEWHGKVWKQGGHYAMRGDFRAISGGELPVILHHQFQHDRKTGDKLELVETALLSLAEMRSIQEEVFAHPARENRVLRIDLAADVEGTTVDWFRENTQVRMKQMMREWHHTTASGRHAETLTMGQKPNQFRVYDKTGHRAKLLADELRKMSTTLEPYEEDDGTITQRSQRSFGLSFEQRWGYPIDRVVTRVERQIGGKAPEKQGIGRVGNLVNLDSIDPFTALELPSDKRIIGPLHLSQQNFPEESVMIEVLREKAQRDGITHAKNYLWRLCRFTGDAPLEDSRALNRQHQRFYRRWKKYKPFVMPVADGNLSRRDLLESFRGSIHPQLKAA